jgi:hypothetical protein
MNNERYNQIIDEAHKNYLNETLCTSDTTCLQSLLGMNLKTGEIGTIFRQYDKEDFIDKCKTDQEFSERWGLKIEERELSLEERSLIANSNHYEVSLNIKGIGVDGDVTLHTHLDELNIPTKLITLLYSNETIEVYE